MIASQNQTEWVKTALRIPRDLHIAVHAEARREARTFNSQLLTFIRESIQTRAKPATLDPDNQGEAA